MTLRVLAIDGGGLRGIIPARVLAELEAITSRPTADLFDLVAGTASGAILALGLAAPGLEGRPRYRGEELVRLFVDQGPELVPAPGPTDRLRRLVGVGRQHKRAVETLAERFGETLLGDARLNLLIPTFDIDARAPMILRSEEFEAGQGPRMSEVALASSSLPTHYPPVSIQLGPRTWALSHGGLSANNPAPLAYAAALAKAEPAEVIFVSLGAGHRLPERQPHLTHLPDPDDGLTRPSSERWPLGVAESFEYQLESSSEAQHQMVEALLGATGHGERYHRIQASLDTAADGDRRADPLLLAYQADEFVGAIRPTLEQVAEQVVA